jgi:hypothetical protein
MHISQVFDRTLLLDRVETKIARFMKRGSDEQCFSSAAALAAARKSTIVLLPRSRWEFPFKYDTEGVTWNIPFPFRSPVVGGRDVEHLHQAADDTGPSLEDVRR